MLLVLIGVAVLVVGPFFRLLEQNTGFLALEQNNRFPRY